MNTTAIAYTKISSLRPTFCPYAIAVVFTNVRELRVVFAAPSQLELVSFDRFGNLQPLPAGLSSLPLYLDDDGFFSVNGLLDLTISSPVLAASPATGDNHLAIHPLIANILGFPDENQRVAPHDHQYLNNDTTRRFVTSRSN